MQPFTGESWLTRISRVSFSSNSPSTASALCRKRRPGSAELQFQPRCYRPPAWRQVDGALAFFTVNPSILDTGMAVAVVQGQERAEATADLIQWWSQRDARMP